MKLVLVFIIIIIVILTLNQKKSIFITNLTVEIGTNFDGGWPATLTWSSNSTGPFNIVLNGGNINCINSLNIVTDQGTCWYHFNVPTKTNGIWTSLGKVYNRSGNDITFTVSTVGISASIVHEVSCILGSCTVLCQRGKVLANEVTLNDYFLQLNGSYKKVKSIKKSIYSGILYKSLNALVTEWHPVRFPNEKDYVIAKEHKLLSKVIVQDAEVYHFELESFYDDILFGDDTLIAESWNNFPHGYKVNRS